MNVTLSRPLDARRANPGDEARATLAQDVESGGEVVLRRGTTVVGRVTEARPRGRRSDSADGGGDSRLGLVFDRAVLRDGREAPIEATIAAVAAAASSTRALDGGVVGAGGASASGRAAGGGLIGGVAGSVTNAPGGVLGSAGSIAGNVGGAARSTLGGAAGMPVGAVGGLSAAGRLMSGSRGVFGMHGVDIASAATGSARGSVLTSRTRNVELERGTQMLLVTSGSAAGSAAGGVNARGVPGRAAGTAGASGSAAGSVSSGVSRRSE
jgi:hypothetical protein